jgi:hypothetical protein
MVLSRDELKVALRQFSQLESEIEELSKGLSALRRQKKELSESVLEFMQHHSIGTLNSDEDNVQVVRVRKTSTAGLKADSIQEELGRILKDDVRAAQVVESIMNNREVIQKESLKKIKKKVVE